RRRDARHRGGEDALLLGVLAQPGEDRLAVHVVEGETATAHAVLELAPGPPVVALDDHAHEVAQRALAAALERTREPRGAEAPAGAFGEDADARERAQHAAQERGVRTDAPREVLGAARTLRELVGEAEPGRDEDELRDPVAGRETEHLLRERRAAARRAQADTTAASRTRASSHKAGMPPYSNPGASAALAKRAGGAVPTVVGSGPARFAPRHRCGPKPKVSCGGGLSRSQRNSAASAPQAASSRFAEAMPIITGSSGWIRTPQTSTSHRQRRVMSCTRASARSDSSIPAGRRA